MLNFSRIISDLATLQENNAPQRELPKKELGKSITNQ
jgi:hypothetical protein